MAKNTKLKTNNDTIIKNMKIKIKMYKVWQAMVYPLPLPLLVRINSRTSYF